jgi:phage baseplate assembly protein W
MADGARHPFGIRVNRGLGWPVELDERSALALTTGVGNVEASMLAILATTPGERVMRPDFGCRLWHHLDDSPDVEAIADAVREALVQWEPRVDVEDVAVVAVHDSVGGVDVDVSFVELATTGRSVARFRCLPEGADANWPFGIRDGRTDRIVLSKARR